MSDSVTAPLNRAEMGPSLTAAVAFIWSSSGLLQALAAWNAGFQHLRIVQRIPNRLARRGNASLTRHIHGNRPPFWTPQGKGRGTLMQSSPLATPLPTPLPTLLACPLAWPLATPLATPSAASSP